MAPASCTTWKPSRENHTLDTPRPSLAQRVRVRVRVRARVRVRVSPSHNLKHHPHLAEARSPASMTTTPTHVSPAR